MERLSYVDKQRTVLEMGRNGENSAQVLDSLFALFASTRDTDNALRVSIVRAVKRVASKDPALVNNGVRRVAIVLASNDAIARAITLRLYALLVDHVDAIDTHHTIIEALESHDDLEYNAAIHAVHQSASTSMFLPEIVQKIMRIHDKQGPMISKKLIHILGRMNRHPSAARKAQSLCQRILKQTPPADTVIACLRSLTQLAIHAPFQIPSQVWAKNHRLVQLCPNFNSASLESPGFYWDLENKINGLIDLLETSSNTSATWITLACLDNLSYLAVNGAAHSFQSSQLKVCIFSKVTAEKGFPHYRTKDLGVNAQYESKLSSAIANCTCPVNTSPILDMDRVWSLIVDNRRMTASSSSSIYAAVDLFCMGLEGGRDERRGQIMEAIGSKIRTEVDIKKVALLFQMVR
ncbi:Integrator complex subunit 7 [Chytriomyces hyalinus]|nr:Integrator complex subunit 7 [Chytriomyces hyalinus]